MTETQTKIIIPYSEYQKLKRDSEMLKAIRQRGLYVEEPIPGYSWVLTPSDDDYYINLNDQVRRSIV
jgi:hypothetical protein